MSMNFLNAPRLLFNQKTGANIKIINITKKIYFIFLQAINTALALATVFFQALMATLIALAAMPLLDLFKGATLANFVKN